MCACCVKFRAVLAKNKLRKKPGKILVEFLKPIEPGLGDDDFMMQLETRIEEATNRLVK